MTSSVEAGFEPLSEEECAELEFQAKFGVPESSLVLRLLLNGRKDEVDKDEEN